MSVRPSLLSATLLVAGAAAAMPLRAQGVEYAPGSTSYHVSTITKGTQTSPMGSQAFEIGVEQRITVNIARRAKDTLTTTVTIDSISLHSAGPTPDVSQYRGLKFTSLVSPTGRIYSTQKPEGQDPLVGQLAESAASFLPSFRGDLHAGATWADTSVGKVTQQGMLVDRTTISTYTVRGDTTIGGNRAVRVTRHMAVSASGSGTPNGSAVNVASSTASDADFFLSRGGAFLGGHSNDDINMKLTIVAQNAEINIIQHAASTVSPIK